MRRTALAATAAFAALLAPAGVAEARSCANADKLPSELTREQVRDATTCALNVERRKHGLTDLRQNHGLALAGQRHARDMVRRRYFSHDSRSGATFTTRIRRTGYLRGNRALLGENLAWGGGRLSTPRQIVASWMNSPGHRANILQGRFREVGIGVVLKLPVAGSGATYAAEFGRTF